jgi:hypothetical protein
MISALVLLASGISLPESGRQLVEYLYHKIEDSRVYSKAGWSAATLNLWIEPNGRIASCTIGRSVGDEHIAGLYCPLLINFRTDFPKDENGRKTFAFMPIQMTITSDAFSKQDQKIVDQLKSQPNLGDADADLPLASPDVTTKSNYFIDLMISPDGSVRACDNGGHTPDNLVEQACALARSKSFAVRRAGSGEPVAYARFVRLVPTA